MTTQYAEEFAGMGQYVPMNLWGKDHWSTLAYIETVMVDYGRKRVEYDPRMRCNSRHFRLLPGNKGRGVRMSATDGSRLSDGRVAKNHDDWDCVLDMAAAGLLTISSFEFDCEDEFALSQLGREISSKLRFHKMDGGTYSNFGEHFNDS